MAEEQNPAGGEVAQAGAGLDMAALTASISAEINKGLNGIAKSLKKDLTADLSKLFTPKQEAAAPADKQEAAHPEGQQQPQSKDNPMLAALQRQLADLKAESAQAKAQAEAREKAAEIKERNADIKAALGKYDLNSVEAAFRFVKDDITRGEDGQLYGADQPLSEFIDSVIKNNQFLLKPKDIGGAGTKPANGRNSTGGRVYTHDDLEPAKFNKLTPEEQAAARLQIANALNG